MTAYEATFFALAAMWSLGLEGPWRSSLPGLLPFVGCAFAMAAPAYALPLAALVACLLPARLVPAGLLLLAPGFTDPAVALKAALLWVVLVQLALGLSRRLDEGVAAAARGVPARLLTVGVLYFALLPLEHL